MTGKGEHILAKWSPEGAVVLRNRRGQILDQVVFVAFPPRAALVRSEKKEEFCQQQDWLRKQLCTPAKRPKIPDRLRHIRSLDEFVMLANRTGQMGLQAQSVKFLIDLRRDQLTHFIRSAKWDLHYTFVREAMELRPPLDRCDDEERREFNRGWYEFSERNYAKPEGRDFLLGTLIRYPGTQAISVEFATGDNISAGQMAMAYHIVRRFVDPRLALQIRPSSPSQEERLQSLGPSFTANMPMDTPYRHATFQLLSPGVAYGTLRVFSNAALANATLGLRVIALLREVPNDIDFVGGIISSQFQSPLSHINVLSRNRGTPHLVLRQPLQQKDVAALVGKLVRLEVTPTGYSLTEAPAAEAEA